MSCNNIKQKKLLMDISYLNTFVILQSDGINMSSKGPRHDKIITNYDNTSFSRQLTVVIPSQKEKICGMNTNATTTKCRMTEAPKNF